MAFYAVEGDANSKKLPEPPAAIRAIPAGFGEAETDRAVRCANRGGIAGTHGLWRVPSIPQGNRARHPNHQEVQERHERVHRAHRLTARPATGE